MIRPGSAPAVVLALLALYSPLYSQEVALSYEGGGSYVLTEKSNWSRYEDGHYLGHVYREVRGRLDPETPARGALWSGEFLVFEETRRDMSAASRRVEEEVPASFRVSETGALHMETDRGFPSLRGFPAFPTKPVRPGDRWIAEGVRMVDPRNQGMPTRTKILAEYEYRGEEVYKGIPVRRIFAKYAVRYKAGQDPLGDPALVEALGTHEADILVRSDTGRPVIIRDSLDETFRFSDGPSLRHKGFTLIFFDAAIPRIGDPASAALRLALGPGEGSTGSRAAVSASTPESSSKPEKGSATGAADPSGPPAASILPGSGLLGAGSEGVVPSGDAPELDLSSPTSGIVVEDRPEGPTLVAFGLRFVPDQDNLLAEEKGRLDGIAAARKGVAGDRLFLVTGHTADVGNPAGQKELSICRAKRIVDELVARGIPASRFLYRGFGAERPLAPNDTEEGRAKNRRVEITVL